MHTTRKARGPLHTRQGIHLLFFHKLSLQYVHACVTSQPIEGTCRWQPVIYGKNQIPCCPYSDWGKPRPPAARKFQKNYGCVSA